jgi:hypothetical protein
VPLFLKLYDPNSIVPIYAMQAELDLNSVAAAFSEAPASMDLNQIGYAGPTVTIGQQTVDHLVNIDADLVVIFAVDGNFQLPDGRLMKDVLGWTSTPFWNQGVPGWEIDCYYDATQCNGLGIYAMDANGQQIPAPGPTILFHELRHAFYMEQRVTPPEATLVADENVYRQDLGFGARDPNNDTIGCLPPASQSGGQGSAGGSACMIAAASSHVPKGGEVQELRVWRERVLRRTRFGSALFDEFIASYYRFSVRVVSEMQASSERRSLITVWLVEPLLIMFKLAKLLTEGRSAAQLEDALLADLAEWRLRARQSPADWFAGKDPSQLVADLRRCYSAWSKGEACERREELDQPDAVTKFVSEMRSLVAAVGADSPVLRWVLVQPLAAYFHVATTSSFDLANTDPTVAPIRSSLAEWIGSPPINTTYVSGMNDEDLVADLAALHRDLLQDPVSARAFCEKLLAGSLADSERVRHALAVAGFQVPNVK